MKKFQSLFLILIVLSNIVLSAKADGKASPGNSSYFELRVYYYSNIQQEAIIDDFLQSNLVPSLHSNGINNVGVFKAMANDTAAIKRMYVFIPFKSLKQWQKYSSQLNSNPVKIGGDYSDAPSDKPAYNRIETIFMKAFNLMPKLSAPQLSGPKSERVYELRSYESAGEKLHSNKVQMFNEGGEMDIFSRLGFNAVFYGQVMYGAKMPNLMYMTSFDNMKAREEHWAAFRSDAAWKTLSGMKEYQKNVSKSEITFLRPTDYSDL